jgi:hypothetical protein
VAYLAVKLLEKMLFMETWYLIDVLAVMFALIFFTLIIILKILKRQVDPHARQVASSISPPSAPSEERKL